MNSEETKTAYPVTCHICKGEFVVYAYPSELENLEGRDWKLVNAELGETCWHAILKD